MTQTYRNNPFFFLLLPSVCFKVFDVDRDGVLSRTELKEMVVALLEVWKDNRTDKIPVSRVLIYLPLFSKVSLEKVSSFTVKTSFRRVSPRLS